MGLQMDGYRGSWICQGVWHSLSKAPGYLVGIYLRGFFNHLGYLVNI